MTIITFGEALIRLTPPGFRRLEQASQLELEVGGAELNTGVGLVRLGHNVSWVSAVPASPLGSLIRSQVRARGVDDQHVITRDGRAGLYFLEDGAAPRPAAIVYDRAGSCMSRLTPGSFDWPRILAPAQAFHVTGITAALSPGTLSVVMEALIAAKSLGLRVSFDVNYRSKLWTPAEAGPALRPMLPMIHLLIASETDAKMLLGIDGDFNTMAQRLHDEFGIEAVASMRREARTLWRDRVWAVGWQQGPTCETPPCEVEVVDRIGTGDAFTAGVIDGWLRRDFPHGLETGTVMGALAHTIRGDLPLFERAEIEAARTGDSLRIRR